MFFDEYQKITTSFLRCPLPQFHGPGSSRIWGKRYGKAAFRRNCCIEPGWWRSERLVSAGDRGGPSNVSVLDVEPYFKLLSLSFHSLEKPSNYKRVPYLCQANHWDWKISYASRFLYYHWGDSPKIHPTIPVFPLASRAIPASSANPGNPNMHPRIIKIKLVLSTPNT